MNAEFSIRNRTSLLYLAGILSVPVWNLTAGYLAAPQWSTRTFFDYLYAPLMLLSFIACIAAPFLGHVSTKRKLGLAVIGIIPFIASFAVSVILTMRWFGLPID